MASQEKPWPVICDKRGSQSVNNGYANSKNTSGTIDVRNFCMTVCIFNLIGDCFDRCFVLLKQLHTFITFMRVFRKFYELQISILLLS